MHFLTLSPEAQSHMAGQLDNSLRAGYAVMCAYPLTNTTDQDVIDVAQLMLVPSGAGLCVWLPLFGQVTSVTLPRNSATLERITQAIQEHAISLGDIFPITSINLIVRCDLVCALSVSIVLKPAVFLLPVEKIRDLCLVLSHSEQLGIYFFYFSIDGVCMTTPEILPISDRTALKLLLARTDDFVNGYCGS